MVKLLKMKNKLLQTKRVTTLKLAQWLAQEIQNPISINEIARLVGNDTALASNVYLAARLVSKDLSRKEIIFLADLAKR